MRREPARAGGTRWRRGARRTGRTGGNHRSSGTGGPDGTDGANRRHGTNRSDGPVRAFGASEPAGPNCAYGGVKYVSASGTDYVCNGAPPKETYSLWGRATCAGTDHLIYSGFVGAFGGLQGGMSGTPMCLDGALSPANWTNWTASLVVRARSTTQTAGNRAEYLSNGNLQCAVCKGSAYVLWGRTTCDAGDTAVSVGHIANMSYNVASGGANAAGVFCVDDTNGQTWTNWGGNDLIVRGASANGSGSTFVQYLEGRDGTCVVCQ